MIDRCIYVLEECDVSWQSLPAMPAQVVVDPEVYLFLLLVAERCVVGDLVAQYPVGVVVAQCDCAAAAAAKQDQGGNDEFQFDVDSNAKGL
jgi:hypothetical protein